MRLASGAAAGVVEQGGEHLGAALLAFGDGVVMLGRNRARSSTGEGTAVSRARHVWAGGPGRRTAVRPGTTSLQGTKPGGRADERTAADSRARRSCTPPHHRSRRSRRAQLPLRTARRPAHIDVGTRRRGEARRLPGLGVVSPRHAGLEHHAIERIEDAAPVVQLMGGVAPRAGLDVAMKLARRTIGGLPYNGLRLRVRVSSPVLDGPVHDPEGPSPGRPHTGRSCRSSQANGRASGRRSGRHRPISIESSPRRVPGTDDVGRIGLGWRATTVTSRQ
jgi:hypothetical protein